MLRFGAEKRKRVGLGVGLMLLDELVIVRNKLVKGDGHEVIDVYAGVEKPRTADDKRPVVVADVVVDVSVDHPAAPCLWIAEHRIMAKGHNTTVGIDFLQRLNALEVIVKLNAVRPRVIVVAQNQVLASVQRLENRLDSCRTEEKVT